MDKPTYLTKRDLTGAQLDVLNMLKGWGRAGSPEVRFTNSTPPSVMWGLSSMKLVEPIPYRAHGWRLTEEGWRLIA